MSAECSSCGKTCQAPESIWYAGTKYDWNVWWVCGACVGSIPVEERHPTTVLMEFETTFGPLIAETNARGVYQGLTSRQGTPQFWVRNDAMARYCAGGQEFVDRFYPFNALAEHVAWFANRVRSGDLLASAGKEKVLRDLTLMGPALERFLYGPGTHRRKHFAPFQLTDLTDEQKNLAEALLKDILDRVASAV